MFDFEPSKNHLRKSIVAAFGFLACFYLLANSVLAGAPIGISTDPQAWKQAVSAYIDRAFSNGNKELHKFYLDGSLPIGVECKYIDDAICDTMNETVQQASKPNYYLPFAVSTNPFLKFVFVDKAHIAELASQAEAQFKGGISDTSDMECEMFSVLSGAEILSSQVLISTGQTRKKIRACLIYQTLLASGLGDVKADQFSLDWGADRGKGISILSDSQMDGYQKISVIMESIHMCKQLSPGMDFDQVKSILLSTEDCFIGLKKE